MAANFELHGQEFIALNGGPVFNFDESISFVVGCETQEEVDFYWDKMGEGGEAVECGWLKDQFGVSGKLCRLSGMTWSMGHIPMVSNQQRPPC